MTIAVTGPSLRVTADVGTRPQRIFRTPVLRELRRCGYPRCSGLQPMRQPRASRGRPPGAFGRLHPLLPRLRGAGSRGRSANLPQMRRDAPLLGALLSVDPDLRLCPPFESARPSELTQPGVQVPVPPPTGPNGPWPRPAAAVPCPQCGARIRQGVEYCPNCGAEQEGAAEIAQYAGFLVRLGAAIIDLLIIVIPAGIIGAIVQIPAFEWIVFGIYHLYNAYFIYTWGQTPGKMLLNIQVVDAHGDKPNLIRVVLREFLGKVVSRSTLLIGYLWIIWDPRKRGWHDYIGGTYVVRRRQD